MNLEQKANALDCFKQALVIYENVAQEECEPLSTEIESLRSNIELLK